MFASLSLPFRFLSRSETAQSAADKDQDGTARAGSAQSGKVAESHLSAEPFVVMRGLKEDWPKRNEVRRRQTVRNHGELVGPHNQQRVYVVSEYWTAEDHIADNGNNHRVHTVFASIQEANAYAQKFVREVLEPYVKSDAWHEDNEELDYDVENVKASKTSFMDGTTRWTLDWGHSTEVEVEEFPVYKSLQHWERNLWMKNPLSWCRSG